MDTKKTGSICLNINQVGGKLEGWSGHTLIPSPLVPPTLQRVRKVSCSLLSLQWLHITMWG